MICSSKVGGDCSSSAARAICSANVASEGTRRPRRARPCCRPASPWGRRHGDGRLLLPLRDAAWAHVGAAHEDQLGLMPRFVGRWSLTLGMQCSKQCQIGCSSRELGTARYAAAAVTAGIKQQISNGLYYGSPGSAPRMTTTSSAYLLSDPPPRSLAPVQCFAGPGSLASLLGFLKAPNQEDRKPTRCGMGAG